MAKAEEIYDIENTSIAELFILYEKAVKGNTQFDGEYELFRHKLERLAIAGAQMERLGFAPTKRLLHDR